MCRLVSRVVHITLPTSSVAMLLRRAWTEAKLIGGLTDLFKKASFSEQAMTKLIRSSILGGANPGERFEF